ncbi:MAG TPA: multicopper oxidase domain-containing protein [Gemmatimonadaceae bacterium]|jgi:nitrite reductase (NO-forming)|nr:multicopper oxidase domain-containing protein [Gemmatimonadaceae bacterium]
MRKQTWISATLGATALLGGLALLTGARRHSTVDRVDFDTLRRATSPVYDPRLAPASDADIKQFRVPIKDAIVEISNGVAYQGWTFGGTVPGPVLRVRQGDSVRVTVVNESPMPHSIDFHAARIPPNVAYRMILPKDSVSFEFLARDAGAFMVHCGTPPVLMHLMQGMYFPIIVDPKGGWGTQADKEYVLVQSEFYAKPGDTAKAGGVMVPMQPDWQAATSRNPSQVVFNGRAFQYKDHPIKVDAGDRVRFFVVNAGPTFNSDFHVVGAVFDRVYPDGNPAHALTGVQTYTVPAGGGVVFEAVFDGGEGLYPFVTHSFADAEKGAVGIIQVGIPKQFATMVH